MHAFNVFTNTHEYTYTYIHTPYIHIMSPQVIIFTMLIQTCATRNSITYASLKTCLHRNSKFNQYVNKHFRNNQTYLTRFICPGNLKVTYKNPQKPGWPTILLCFYSNLLEIMISKKFDNVLWQNDTNVLCLTDNCRRIIFSSEIK